MLLFAKVRPIESLAPVEQTKKNVPSLYVLIYPPYEVASSDTVIGYEQ